MLEDRENRNQFPQGGREGRQCPAPPPSSAASCPTATPRSQAHRLSLHGFLLACPAFRMEPRSSGLQRTLEEEHPVASTRLHHPATRAEPPRLPDGNQQVRKEQPEPKEGSHCQLSPTLSGLVPQVSEASPFGYPPATWNLFQDTSVPPLTALSGLDDFALQICTAQGGGRSVF